jgi:hypothetical protein
LVYPWPPCVARPDPGVDASEATSFLMPRRHRSLVAALASAPFASPSSPASPIHRPRSEHGQIGQAPLVRFRLFPSAFAGRAVPSEVTSLRTIPLRRFSGPGTHAKGSARPCGFSRLASPVLSFSRYGDAARAGHSWPVLCAAHVPDSRIGQLSRPDRDRQNPGDARGIHISPFAVLLSSAGEGASQRPSHPPAVSPLAAASFIVAGSTSHG